MENDKTKEIYLDNDGNYVVSKDLMEEVLDAIDDLEKENGKNLLSIGKTPYCCLAWNKIFDCQLELVETKDCSAYFKFQAEDKCNKWFYKKYNDLNFEKQLAQDACDQWNIGDRREGGCD